MFKKILIGTLATLVLGAASVSAYNAASETTVVSAEETQNENFISALVHNIVQSQTKEQTQTTSQFGNQNGTQGQGQGQQGAGGSGYRGGRNENWTSGSGSSAAAQVSIHGTLTDIGLAAVTFTADDGQSITVNLNPAALGLTLNVGDGMTVSGNWFDETTFTPMHVTLDATGETFSLNMGAGSGGATQGQGGQGQGGQGQGGQGGGRNGGGHQ